MYDYASKKATEFKIAFFCPVVVTCNYTFAIVGYGGAFIMVLTPWKRE